MNEFIAANEPLAKLVEVMIHQKPWSDHPWARAALATAARAVRRGRHLTEAEKAENLAKAFDKTGDTQIAARLRAGAALTPSQAQEADHG